MVDVVRSWRDGELSDERVARAMAVYVQLPASHPDLDREGRDDLVRQWFDSARMHHERAMHDDTRIRLLKGAIARDIPPCTCGGAP